jgi:hypothetical protein
MSLSRLTQTECIRAVHQCINSKDFRQHNPHLTPNELHQLNATIPIWPAKPVFSPYATTHDGYSQIRFNGTKYLMHAIGFKSYHGQPQFSDVSHTLYVGARTTR